MSYNEKLVSFLIGRKLMPEQMPIHHHMGPMFSLWGEEAGLRGSDVHATRTYRIYLSYGDDLVITDARVVVDGELISPCSGYWQEELDEFDYPCILAWCEARTIKE